MPEVYGRTIDGLGMFKIQKSTPGSVAGHFQITVRENISRSSVVVIRTQPVIVNQGVTDFPRGLFPSSIFNYSPNPTAAIANQTRSFVPGEYTFCYHFIPDDKYSTDDFESCFDANIQPLVPISLIIPNDMDTICMKRPLLSWQPPMPFDASMKYRLLLTEKKNGEAVENLFINKPLLFLDDLNTNTLVYPASVAELQENHTYTWQVIVYQSKLIISKSEIWEFTVQCREPLKPLPADSYREIKTLVNGNYYIAVGGLKFSITNNYSARKLSYSITSLQDDRKPVDNLPAIELKQGLNKVDIDLREMDLREGGNYLLHISPFNEPGLDLRFIYRGAALN